MPFSSSISAFWSSYQVEIVSLGGHNNQGQTKLMSSCAIATSVMRTIYHSATQTTHTSSTGSPLLRLIRLLRGRTMGAGERNSEGRLPMVSACSSSGV
jgi:hypothetical protein